MHRRLLQLAWQSRFSLAITILSGFVTGLLAIGQAYLISTTINNVFLQNEKLFQVWSWLRILMAVIAARGMLIWVNEVAASDVAIRVKNDLRARLFEHILTLGPGFTRAEHTGELSMVAVEGIEALDAYFSQYLPQFFISILVPLSILLVVFPIDPLSGAILLLTAPLIPFFMYLIGRAGEGLTKRQFETLGRFSAYFIDSLQGLTTLKLFGQSKAQVDNIARVSDEYRNATLKVLQVTFLSAFALELVATLSTAIIAVEVGLRLLYSHMYFREALFLLILAPEFYLPLRMLGLRFHAGIEGTTAARRIFEILDTPQSIPYERKTVPGSRILTHPARVSKIEISNLSYTYPGEIRPALDNISLTILAGEHIALIGASGAGKTTLAELLLGFMVPTGGQIVVDREPLTEKSLDDWRPLIAWVPQTPHLFHDTIAANIRIGKSAASMEEITYAARAANLEEFIDSLPEKYNTQIGEAGARLSSGQSQRIALARAFLKDASILILDEPTSSVDPEVESFLEDSTGRLMKDRTVITIAHRLNTVFKADRIVVLNKGRIVETGTHSELLAKKSVYSRMLRAGWQGFNPTVRLVSLGVSEPEGIVPMPAPPDRSRPVISRPRSTIFRLLQFLEGSWWWVALSVCLGSLTIGSNIALMAISAWLISTAALHPSIAALEVAIVGVRFFGVSRAVFRYFERLNSHNVTLRLLGRVRVWFFTKMEPLAPARLLEYRAGDLLARIIGDVATLESFYVRLVSPPLIAILVVIGAGLFLVSINLSLAIVVVFFFIVLGVILPVTAQALTRHAGEMVISRRADLHAQLVDGVQGLPDILAFGQAQDFFKRLKLTSRICSASQRTLAYFTGFQSGVASFLTNFALWLVLFMAITLCIAGRIDGVMLAPLALLTLSTFEAVTPLPVAAQIWSSTQTAAKRLIEIVDLEPVVETDGDTSVHTVHTTPSLLPSLPVPYHQTSISQSLLPSIEFSNLSFSYPNQSNAAIQNVSFSIPGGHNLAIVGPSGAGKSTLANLLLRFWDYSKGDIHLSGSSLKDLNAEDVRAKIAFVSPNTYFFNTSIYENIRIACSHATRHAIEAAAMDAHLHGFIMSLPRGYDTVIGERGLRLSAGERQRLAIARAIIKNTPILILDEPTANLDPVTESQVLDSLFQLMRRKTSILITHRLVGLENIAEILVMEHGSIVELGSLTELLAHGGLFRRLWDLQNRFLAATK